MNAPLDDIIDSQQAQLTEREHEQAERLLRLNFLSTIEKVSLANIQAVQNLTDKLSQVGDGSALIAALRVLERSSVSTTLFDKLIGTDRSHSSPKLSVVSSDSSIVQHFPKSAAN